MAKGRRFRAWLVLVLLAAGAAGGWWYWREWNADGDSAQGFRLAEVRRGELVASVSASGTLNAVTTVQVGSQVSGMIKELKADFNSEVREGQVIALIDPVKFEARVARSTAELKVARASVTIRRAAVKRAEAERANGRAALAAAEANRDKAAVGVVDAKRRLRRQRALLKSDAVSQSQLDEAEAGYDQSVAQLGAAKAQASAASSVVASRRAAVRIARAEVDYARAQVVQKQAALEADKVDLAYTVITSPVNGVVIRRSVDVGQTVAASLQAPELFTIARDLSRMQVDASIDEADIGRVVIGQETTYTVDAFPGREFKGRVSQIRKAPNTIQNVVTYTVVISTANPDRVLLPGMTANVRITVARRADTVMTPNAALRFSPREKELASAVSGQTTATGGDKAAKDGQATPPAAARAGQGGGKGDRRAALARRIARLTKALDLTPDQVRQLKESYVQAWQKLKELRAQGLSREEIKARAELVRQQNQTAFKGLLSPEQRDKLNRLTAARARATTTPGRVWILGPDGRPVPRDLTLGITDGAFTEVVKGELVSGQKVITGRRLKAGGGR